MTAIDYRDARFQARAVQNAVIIGDAMISEGGGPPLRWITCHPFADMMADPKAFADTLAEIHDKLRPKGWVNLDGANGTQPGCFGRSVR